MNSRASLVSSKGVSVWLLLWVWHHSSEGPQTMYDLTNSFSNPVRKVIQQKATIELWIIGCVSRLNIKSGRFLTSLISRKWYSCWKLHRIISFLFLLPRHYLHISEEKCKNQSLVLHDLLGLSWSQSSASWSFILWLLSYEGDSHKNHHIQSKKECM